MKVLSEPMDGSETMQFTLFQANLARNAINPEYYNKIYAYSTQNLCDLPALK